jgi:hypothetical protein
VNALPSTPTAGTAAARGADRSVADRLLAVVPLLSVYTWLCVVYLVEVWSRATPWLFGDELELTQLSRSIAATGHPAERGVPTSPHSLYTYLMAPVWLIDHVPTAYAGIKYLDVLVMTSVVFPAYFLTRLIAGRRASLFAAAGAGAIPALAYTGYIVEENLAYPYATLCLFLIAKSVALVHAGRPAGRWLAGAVVASAVAPLVRGELGVVPAVLVLAFAFAAWSTERGRAWRRSWSLWDWLGTTVLVLGLIFAVSAAGSHRSFAWEVATRIYKHRMLNMTGWAAGSLAIGIGVFPLAAGLASLFPARGEARSPQLRAFRSTMLGALVCFGVYTAIKAAYLSYSFATRVEERNLTYVAPLLFAGTALLLELRRANWWALAGGTVLAAYLVGYAMYHPTGFPYELNVQLYSDALGLAILQEANRVLRWTPETARVVLLVLALAGALLFAALARWRDRPRVAGLLTAVLAVGVVGWTLTGQLSAAAGSNRAGRQAADTLRHPFSWVDDATHGARTLYMGEGESDPNQENLLEFWNRSIVRVGSLDGTVHGPGPSGSPNVAANGEIYWTVDPANPGDVFDYAVEDFPCVDFAGSLAGTHAYRGGGTTRVWRLIRLTSPNRLQAMCTGIYPDGWTGAADSSYFRFSGARGGWLRVVVSRRDWGGPTGPSPVHVQIAGLRIDETRQPALAGVTRQVDGTIDSNQTKVVWVRTPGDRFAVHVVVDRKFIPRDSDPNSSDGRVLGAEVTYRFFPTRPPGARETPRF